MDTIPQPDVGTFAEGPPFPADVPPASVSTARPARTPVNLRTLTVGSLLVAMVAGLVPYNDFVVGNGFLIACYLPVVFVLCLFTITVVINAPLRKWFPNQSFSGNELGVIGLMMLTGCSIPCQGLLRAFLPALVHPFYHGQFDNPFWKTFTALGLPGWLYPVDDIATGRSSPVMTWFYNKVPDGQAIPYSAWLKPLLGWSVFLVSMFTATVSAALLLYTQWSINERLPFPIAQVELALISEPQRDRLFNGLYHSRLFWIGTAVAFLLQNQVALHIYFPKQMPAIPLDYDLTRILTSDTWLYVSTAVKKNAIVFVYVAMGYFVQARVGFSVWSIFLLVQAVTVVRQTLFTLDLPGDAVLDQHLGASLVFMASVFWVGRHHWRKTFAERGNPNRVLLTALLIGVAGMLGWLWVVGVSLPMGCLIVFFILLAHAVTARVVAETGLPIFRSYATSGQLYMRMPVQWFNGTQVYFAQLMTTIAGAFPARESVMVFVQHARWIFDRSEFPVPKKPVRRPVGLLMAWALILSFFVGSISSLHCYYSYPRPISRLLPLPFINARGQEDLPTHTVAEPLVQFAQGRFNPPSWNPAVHMGVGAAVCGVLAFLAMRFSGWPLLPVGYILATTPFVSWCWYSMMLGWIAKVLVLRFGGAKMFQNAKPLFIGLIVGEALAAGGWIVINIVLAQMGYDYRQIIFYPS